MSGILAALCYGIALLGTPFWYQTSGDYTSFTSQCKHNICEVYLTEGIFSINNYLDLYRQIETAPYGAVINIHLEGFLLPC
jgi:hypothetical protein